MACKLQGGYNSRGLEYIYNVSRHVGGRNTCPNFADDVQLVQFFIREVVPRWYSHLAISELPRPTGRMDPVTAFWIYDIQRAADSIMEIDGIVSPAKGLTYGSNVWLISALNYKYKQFFPELFDKIPLNPELSPSLRASIAA